MLKSILMSWACCAMLLAPLAAGVAAGADLEARKNRSLRSPIESRIVRVEVDDGRLFISGENLPEGSDVEVRLGGESLRVIRSSRLLVVAELPSTRPEHVDELVVEAGLSRAVARGRGLRWGLRWATPIRETRDAEAEWEEETELDAEAAVGEAVDAAVGSGG